MAHGEVPVGGPEEAVWDDDGKVRVDAADVAVVDCVRAGAIVAPATSGLHEKKCECRIWMRKNIVALGSDCRE